MWGGGGKGGIGSRTTASCWNLKPVETGKYGSLLRFLIFCLSTFRIGSPCLYYRRVCWRTPEYVCVELLLDHGVQYRSWTGYGGRGTMVGHGSCLCPKVVAKTSVHINTCSLFTPFVDEISALEHSLVIRKALPYRENNVFLYLSVTHLLCR